MNPNEEPETIEARLKVDDVEAKPKDWKNIRKRVRWNLRKYYKPLVVITDEVIDSFAEGVIKNFEQMEKEHEERNPEKDLGNAE